MDSAQQNVQSLIQPEVSQEKLILFVKSLKDFGLDRDRCEEITMGVAKSTADQTMAKISMIMDDEDWDKWKKFVDTKANTAQQLIVMNELLKKRLNKSLEELQDEILDSLIADTLEQLQKGQELSLKISKLSDDKVQEVNQALDDGDYEKVDQLINNKE